MMYDTRYFEGLLLDTDNLSAVHFQLWRVGIKSYWYEHYNVCTVKVPEMSKGALNQSQQESIS